MNKAQKLVLTIYILASVIAYLIASYNSQNICNSIFGPEITLDCTLQHLIDILQILFYFGIPTFILYFLWRDKKIKEEKS
jgi:uncharacterized membrane-anchored protein YitT (DUF2179 family)